MPSGFDHVVDVSVRSDTTSTGEPWARAVTAAVVVAAESGTSTRLNVNAANAASSTTFDGLDVSTRRSLRMPAHNSLTYSTCGVPGPGAGRSARG